MKTKLLPALSLLLILTLSLVLTAQAQTLASTSTRYIMDPFLSPDWIGESDRNAANYGSSVASAGDVNGDGYDDIIVGASYYANGQDAEGAAYLYYGSATGVKTVPAWLFESNQAHCEIGWSVASAGDINNDGFDDVLVGSEFCNLDGLPEEREGRVYLFYGSASGLSPIPNWTRNGEGFKDSFGTSLGSAGDVNHDGYDDVIIGAPWALPEQPGKVYVFYGSASGLKEPPWTLAGQQNWGGLGSSVASAGDVNADGYDDVIIGQDHMDNPEADEGRAYVYLGSSTGLKSLPAWQFENNKAGSGIGESVASAGDVNGDGFDDILVGGFRYSNPEEREGIAYLFLGSVAGPSTTPSWQMESNQAYAEFGQSVASAGDVNQDGFDDVLVGAPWYSNGQSFEGVAFLYYGSPTGLLSSPVHLAESNQVEANLGYYARSAGDVNGDGIADMIVGAQRYDGGQDNEGRAIVYQGIPDATSQIYLPITIR